jgi:thiamine biosynthesis protein ThiS
VERNREILERARLDRVTVEEGDALEVVHFVGGG